MGRAVYSFDVDVDRYHFNDTYGVEPTGQRLAIARDMGDVKGAEATLGNLGVLYDQLGEYDKAIACYEQAITIAQRTDDLYSKVMNNWNMVLIQEKRGHLQHAFELMQGAVVYFTSIDDAQKARMMQRKLRQIEKRLQAKDQNKNGATTRLRKWWHFWE